MSDDVVPIQQAAGWYDDGTGTTRWWSGRDWTEHTTDQKPNTPGASAEPKQSARHPLADDPGTLWSAVGRPLTGLGAHKVRLTSDLLYFERGMLGTDAQQVHTWEIHDVDAKQGLMQKSRGVGNITVHTARHGRPEVVLLEDLPDFREGVNVINSVAHDAIERRRLAERTQHVNYSGGAPVPGYAQVPPQPSFPAPESTPSPLLDQLAKLAEMKTQGLLTDSEFTAAKAKLLGL